MIAKPRHNIREIRQQRDHQDEQQLDPQWTHVEQQVEGLLRVSKRIVDRVFRFSPIASRPELTVAVAQAMLAKFTWIFWTKLHAESSSSSTN
jgi:hypothetical protein